MTASGPGVPRRAAVAIFLCFAFAYFFSALVRAIVATLAPTFSAELGLSAADLGLLAGAYFLGFACMQLPLGSALDRFGAKRVLLAFLGVAVIGCVLFAQARDFLALTSARALIGAGVGACLMAPMTSFRHSFTPMMQMRATSWMLMTGSLGMVASTLPVQWLLPHFGWRGLFWLLAAFFVLAMLAIAKVVPRDVPEAKREASRTLSVFAGYGEVIRHRTFIRLMPMGFFHFGGLVALQALWIGPWLSSVCGWTPSEAATGLFTVNVGMLLAFLTWGVLVPRLYARGWTAQHLIARCVPLSLVLLVAVLALGARATALAWTIFCVASTVVALAQPAVGHAFRPELAGRALSAYNLVLFAGIFVLQWIIGGLIDLLSAAGWSVVSAFRSAFAVLGVGCLLSYLWFLWFDDMPVLTRPIDTHGRTGDNLPPCQES